MTPSAGKTVEELPVETVVARDQLLGRAGEKCSYGLAGSGDGRLLPVFQRRREVQTGEGNSDSGNRRGEIVPDDDRFVFEHGPGSLLELFPAPPSK